MLPAGCGVHHFVTGIVSAVPVLNLLILPVIWHKVYAWVLAGIIGLLIAIGSWYAGAEEHVYRYAAGNGISIAPPVANKGQIDESTQDKKKLTDFAAEETPATPLAPGQELPRKSLYKMTYQTIGSRSLDQYVGSYVRITRTDRKTFEGKILGPADNGVMIERRVNGGIIEQRVSFGDITAAEVMKQP